MAKLGACLCSRVSLLGVVSLLHSLPYAYTIFPLFWVLLAKAGTQVVVPFRDEDEKRHLKVMGDLGQIVPLVRRIVHLRDIRLTHAHSLGFCRNGT